MSGSRVVDFTNYVFASMQKDRETPIGKAITNHCSPLAVAILHAIKCMDVTVAYVLCNKMYEGI